MSTGRGQMIAIAAFEETLCMPSLMVNFVCVCVVN